MNAKKRDVKVSVIMCTYNGALYVAAQIASIKNQTYPIGELLVFDDASTDNTISVLQKLAEDYSSMKIFANKYNIGFTKNFQQALQAASGDVIAIADQDDVWKAEKLEKLISAWQPEVPLIYCASISFQKEVPLHAKPQNLFYQLNGKDARTVFLYNCVSGHATMIRKDLLERIFPLPDTPTYDWWMAVVAAYNGGVQYVDEVLVYQRQHNNNITLHGDKLSPKQLKRSYKLQSADACKQFALAPNIPASHKRMALRFARLMEESLHYQFYLPLFFFLLRHSKTLFRYKGPEFRFYYYLKQSYRQTLQ